MCDAHAYFKSKVSGVRSINEEDTAGVGPGARGSDGGDASVGDARLQLLHTLRRLCLSLAT